MDPCRNSLVVPSALLLVLSMVLPAVAQPQTMVKPEDVVSDAWWPIAYIQAMEDGSRQLRLAGPGIAQPVLLSGRQNVSTLGPQREYPFDWSPDGSRLAFLAEGQGNASLILSARSNGATTVLAASLPAGAYAPQWSPSGSYLVVLSTEGAQVVTAADGKVAWISTSAVTKAIWASRTDDLALVSRGGIEVWSPRSDRALSVPETQSVNGKVQWSHDAQLLAFDGMRRDGTKGVIIVRPSAATSADVAEDLPNLSLVDVSPVADEILVAAPVAPGRSLVLRLAPPWREAEDLTALIGPTHVMPDSETLGGYLASYSPDGADVALVAHPTDSLLQRYLYIVSGNGVPRCVSEPIGVQSVTWSKDSRQIAFTGRRGSVGRLSQSIYIVSPTGGEPVRLATNVLGYDWDPAGGSLAYLTALSRSGNLALGTVSTSTAEERWLAIDVLRADFAPR